MELIVKLNMVRNCDYQIALILLVVDKNPSR
jgi:hypothetical protein